EHVGPNDDFHLGYRTEKEVFPWKKNDQLAKLRSLLDISVVRQLESKIDRDIKAAFEFAEESPFPESQEVCEDVFKE
ncbi:thiamine pyrophosphate-dependent dehydrogenase E1 component subunit alpha, partial [bacterium]|nr:thiamine pyrophosphate-dependent dehydrogenase E1 component subunit alpha [bacterium]